MSVTEKYPTLDPELAPFIAAMMQGSATPSSFQEERAMINTMTAGLKETLKDSFPPGGLGSFPSVTLCLNIGADLDVC